MKMVVAIIKPFKLDDVRPPWRMWGFKALP
jgi:nitrogen regulatory protein PII